MIAEYRENISAQQAGSPKRQSFDAGRPPASRQRQHAVIGGSFDISSRPRFQRYFNNIVTGFLRYHGRPPSFVSTGRWAHRHAICARMRQNFIMPLLFLLLLAERSFPSSGRDIFTSHGIPLSIISFCYKAHTQYTCLATSLLQARHFHTTFLKHFRKDVI